MVLKKSSAYYDVTWVSFLFTMALGYCLVGEKDLFSCSVLLSGILCVGLTAIGRKEGYIIGFYNSLSYALMSYENSLYGEVLLNLGFFIPTGVAGYLLWKANANKQVVLMRSLSWRNSTLIFFLCLILTFGLGLLLRQIEGQNTPFVDAGTNVLSVLATFLMIYRFKEQWLLYFALNVLTIVMWVLRWQANGLEGDTMIVMWSLYLINSVFGFVRWHKGSKLNLADKNF